MNSDNVHQIRTEEIQSDGGDIVANGQTNITRNEKEKGILLAYIGILIACAAFVGSIDFAYMYEVFTRSFANEFGEVDPMDKAKIMTSSFATLACYTFIGSLHKEQPAKAIAAYVVMIIFVAYFSDGLWGDISSFLMIHSSDWATDPSQNINDNSLLEWKIGILLIIAIVFSLIGLLFSSLERKIIEKYKQYRRVLRELQDSYGIVNAYQMEKSRTDAENELREQSKKQVAYLKNKDNISAFAKLVEDTMLLKYTQTLTLQLNRLPSVSSAMSRNDQETTTEKKQQLLKLIAQAKSLKDGDSQ